MYVWVLRSTCQIKETANPSESLDAYSNLRVVYKHFQYDKHQLIALTKFLSYKFVEKSFETWTAFKAVSWMDFNVCLWESEGNLIETSPNLLLVIFHYLNHVTALSTAGLCPVYNPWRISIM